MRSFAVAATVLASLAHANLIDRRQLVPEEPDSTVAATTATLTSLSQDTVPTDTATLDKVTEGYLLPWFLTYSTIHTLKDYSTTDFDNISYLIHQVRCMPNNSYRELRSRFFIAENNHRNVQLGHDLTVHTAVLK
ncbi:hypothetical protein ASPCADRAFT_135237 [Aspergillus carbonarius ITEM 5010]|uniref:Uncharacterized protein n=1 Tax=Aspergillus carbonarius (strain ITEM 5010) TaxID=602072 RepID=A0A1R3R785_ASPC5|nr:hypothetical protein ASPCADRAFT_135237 [Aspergillus carbonarius ITEM 5010]